MKLLRSPRVVYAAIASAVVVLPFAVVTFPPLTDLPQHLAQIRLLLDAIHQPGSTLAIHWWTPYTLAYLVLAGFWLVLPPLAVGRAAFAAVGVAWVVATALVARQRSRSPAIPLVAAVVYFGTGLYWGFLPFLAGLPVFLVWYALSLRRPDRFRASDVPVFLGGALLLYVAHALWFAAGLLWLAVRFAAGRGRRRVTLLRGLATLPVVAGALVWYPSLASGGFRSRLYYGANPLARLSPIWLANGLSGGLRGATPIVVTGVLLVVLGAAVWRATRGGWETVDRDALLAAGLFLVLVFVLPYKFQNTIALPQRWLPVAAILLALALPAPKLLPSREGMVLALVAVAFSVSTTFAWMVVDRSEMAGVGAALAALPRRCRLLELDFAHRSPLLRHRPFMQVMAYAQATKDCSLAFSFDQFANMPVVDTRGPKRPWTPGLEWYPRTVKRSDMQYFDFVLVHGGRKLQAQVTPNLGLEAVTAGLPWRLYRVPESGAEAHP